MSIENIGNFAALNNIAASKFAANFNKLASLKAMSEPSAVPDDSLAISLFNAEEEVEETETAAAGAAAEEAPETEEATETEGTEETEGAEETEAAAEEKKPEEKELSLEDQADILGKDLEAIGSDIEAKQAELDAKIAEQQQLEAEQQKLQADIEIAQAEGDQQRVAELQGDLEGVGGKLDAVGAEISSLQGDVSSLNSNMSAKKGELDTVTRKLEEKAAAAAAAAAASSSSDKSEGANGEGKKAGDDGASAAAQKAEQTSKQAQQQAQKAEQTAQQANQAANNANQAAQQANNSASKAGGTSAAGGAGSTKGVQKAGETNAAGSKGASNIKGSTNTDGTSVLDDDLDFSGADATAVAKGIEDYAASKGYTVPEGFGSELMKVCDDNDIDYGMALSVCASNGFGQNGNGLMGFGAAGEGKDAWKSELGSGVSQLATLREQGGSSSAQPVKSQLEAIGAKTGDASWAKEAYANYSENVSPALAGVEGVQSGYLSYIQDIMQRQQGCRTLQGNETLYKVMAKADGISEDEARAIVDARIQEVTDTYSGADASCMSALTMMDIAADYGVKLKYGAANTPSKLARDIDPGVVSDCRNFVSWSLDKGYEDDIYSMNVGQMGLGYSENGIHEKHTSNYGSMNAGDIVTKNSTHAMMAVYNDPSTKTMIIAESSGHNTGVQLRTVSYQKAQQLGYTFVDASTVYDGTADCYNYGRTH